MPIYTRPDRDADPFKSSQLVAPGLIFQKWQPWDGVTDGNLERKTCRSDFLSRVARSVQTVYEKKYNSWYERYKLALRGLNTTTVPYTTVWRLIIGWGNNPTLEAGLSLHPLLGFPYIPGAALKGLLHHVAEMEIMDDPPRYFLDPALDNPPPEAFFDVLKRLNNIRLLFGSIHLERDRSKDGKERYGPRTPREELIAQDRLLNNPKEKLSDPWRQVADKTASLLKGQTGGMLRFYDAVPESCQSELLQMDIVNCHYSEYYRQNSTHPPSDDQQPIPVTFLAVRPGVKFLFAWALEELPSSPPRDNEEAERRDLLCCLSKEHLTAMVKGWLERGLGMWGIGAKTASGYGYFDTGQY